MPHSSTRHVRELRVTDAAGETASEHDEIASDYPPPKILSATVDATGLAFSVQFLEGTDGNVTFALTADGVARALVYVDTALNAINFTCEQVLEDEVCLLSYTRGDVVDAGNGRPLMEFSDYPVVNNSTAT